ncbi:MAG: 16S rRNA (uracil(1498)-N(3))-methyltransferase [Candidatus Dormibacteraeota bacterium]|nr:16S rRNA (uracil(1498)-N(3))-methyltransferase [Candidatus Dormibacteraeota bacterium]
MPERFFIDQAPDAAGNVHIDGPVARHVARSLRMRAGDAIVAVDPDGREHGVRLRDLTAAGVEGVVEWSRSATGEPRLRITVVQALPRVRMDDCVDILVEAGATAVQPVVSERVVSRPDPSRTGGRTLRWQAVAQEAAQLSGRGIVPRVHATMDLATGLSALAAGTRIVAATFNGTRPLASLEVDRAQPLALCIGPEGGFGARDLRILHDAGAETVHIGPRILRTRYAGAVGCALLLAAAGDLAEPVATEPRP